MAPANCCLAALLLAFATYTYAHQVSCPGCAEKPICSPLLSCTAKQCEDCTVDRGLPKCTAKPCFQATPETRNSQCDCAARSAAGTCTHYLQVYQCKSCVHHCLKQCEDAACKLLCTCQSSLCSRRCGPSMPKADVLSASLTDAPRPTTSPLGEDISDEPSIVLYSEPNFMGRQRRIVVNTPNVGEAWINSVRSFIVTSGSWTLYKNINYLGESKVYEQGKYSDMPIVVGSLHVSWWSPPTPEPPSAEPSSAEPSKPVPPVPPIAAAAARPIPVETVNPDTQLVPEETAQPDTQVALDETAEPVAQVVLEETAQPEPSPSPPASPTPAPRIIVFDNFSFTGNSIEFTNDTYWIGDKWNDRARSFIVVAGTWRLFRHSKYREPFQDFGPGSVARMTWPVGYNHLSSLKIIRPSPSPSASPAPTISPSPSVSPSNSLPPTMAPSLSASPSSSPVESLTPNPTSSAGPTIARASSVEKELSASEMSGSPSVTLPPSLSSSASPSPSPSHSGFMPAPASMSSMGIAVYTQKNFQGASTVLFGNTNRLNYTWNDRISSVQVWTGTWRLYQHTYYNGRFGTYPPGNYSEMGEPGDNTISSISQVA